MANVEFRDRAKTKAIKTIVLTSMHSSRMRIACLLTYLGVCLLKGGLPSKDGGGVCLPMALWEDRHREQNDTRE